MLSTGSDGAYRVKHSRHSCFGKHAFVANSRHFPLDDLRGLILLFRHILSNFEFSAHNESSILFLKYFPCSLLNLKSTGSLGKVTQLRCCQKRRPECTEVADKCGSWSNSGAAWREKHSSRWSTQKKSHRSAFQVYELNAENKCAHLRFLHSRASRCVCARHSASGRSLGLRFSLRTEVSLKQSRDDHRWCFGMELYSDMHHPQSPPRTWLVPWEQKKNKKITPSLKYQTAAAGSRQKEWSPSHIHAEWTRTTALKQLCFFHDPSSRNKQHFVRRKVFFQQGITCIYFSLSLSRKRTWSGSRFHVVMTEGNRRKFYCTDLIYAKLKVHCAYTIVNKKKKCCCSLSKLDKVRREQTVSCVKVTVKWFSSANKLP